MLKGKFRVEIDAGTAIGREWIAICPKDVQNVTTLINDKTGEEVQMVSCYNRVAPYTIRMPFEEYCELSNGVEE